MHTRGTDALLEEPIATPTPNEPAPGRGSVTARMPPSARAIARAMSELRSPPASGPTAPVQRSAASSRAAIGGGSFLDEILHAPPPRAAVQCDGSPAAAAPDVHAAAARGTSGPASRLPFFDEVQRAFGHHDVSGVRAHVGGPATEASAAIGARAYATGDAVAFAAAPDLHLAAHEAAHVVQQRGGVRLSGGVGRAGDEYERHADAVAELVVRGESAEAMLDGMAHRGAAGGPAVQRDPPRDGSATPAPAPGGAAPAGGRHAPFDTVWTLDYHGRFAGAGQAAGARTPSSALMVRSLNVAPTEGDTRGRTFSGLQMRDSGPVELGHYAHPANQGGMVSGSVSYVTERALHLQVTGVDRVEGAAIAQQIRDGLQDSFVTGDVSAQATAVLTDEQRGRGVTVTASLQPGTAAAVETRPAAYGAVDHDGQQLNVMVDIPMGTRDHQTQGRREREGQLGATQGHELAQSAQRTQAVTDTQREQVTQQLERAYMQRVNQIATDITQHVISHTETSSWQFQATAGGQLGLSAALNGTIDTTSIIGRLPLGLGSLVARLIPQIVLTVTPSLQMTVGAQLQHATSTTDDDRNMTEHRDEIQRAFEQTLRQLWSQQSERTHSLVTTVSATQGATDRAGVEQRTRALDATGYSDTVRLPVAAGAPTLSVTAGSRGGA